MSFFELRGALAGTIAAGLAHPEISADTLLAIFSMPPPATGAHVALPCFALSTIIGKPSGEIASRIATLFDADEVVAHASGPYVNFRWDAGKLYRQLIERVGRERDRYGSDESGSGRTVVVEYGSPDVAKPLTFSHLRSALVGNALANVHAFLGYRTERICFLGDWGGQFARLLAGIDLWGDRERIAQGGAESARHLLDLSVKFQRAYESDPAYADRAARWRQALESRDAKAIGLWQQARASMLTAVIETLRRLHVGFDHVEGESAYLADIEHTLENVKQRAGARRSEGAWIVDIEGLPPAVIEKKDGTTLSLTRDIAAALDRWERFHPEKMLYVFSEQQRLHFNLLFGVLRRMGCEWATRCAHVSFGSVQIGGDHLPKREGRVVFLDDVLAEAKARALAFCTEKTPNLVDKESVAERVGMAALVFGELTVARSRAIEFHWESALALDGDTGPYVQYAAVRCASVLEKAAARGEGPGPVDGPLIFGQDEENLIVTLTRFGTVLHRVTREAEPCQLAHYLIEVAKSFNRFYYRFPVLQAGDATQRRARLNLVEATRQTLVNGLRLLGIECPPEM